MDIELLIKMHNDGRTWAQISKASSFKAHSPNALRKAYYRNIRRPDVKILLLDIETKPIIAHVWQQWQNDVALNQIQEDWSVLSWSAKWLHDDKIMYRDNRGNKDLDDDKEMLKEIWNLMDESDIIIGHYSDKFDIPKLFARFAYHDMGKPSDFRTIDTKTIASSKFNFTSNKLEYLAKFLKVKLKKLTNRVFAGHSLWSECMKNNILAWQEMELYNKRDVLVLEGVYHKLKKWDKKINFDVYHDTLDNKCRSCGTTSFVVHPKKPFAHTNAGKFQRYVCTTEGCRTESVSKVNLLSKEKKQSLRK